MFKPVLIRSFRECKTSETTRVASAVRKKSTVAFLHYKMYTNLLLYSAIINHINAKMARSHQLWHLGFAVLCLPASVVHLSLLRSVSLWDNSSQWPSLCDLSKYFSDEFMGLFASLRSYLTKPEAHFLNDRQNSKRIRKKNKPGHAHQHMPITSHYRMSVWFCSQTRPSFNTSSFQTPRWQCWKLEAS